MWGAFAPTSMIMSAWQRSRATRTLMIMEMG